MKLIKYIILSCTVLLFVQCSDLSEEPYTFLSPNNYYNTGDELSTALTGVYDGYQRGFNGYYKYIMYLEVRTEFGSPAYAKDDVHLWNIWSDVNNADKMVITNWDDAYNIINRANLVIGRGEKVSMAETLKTRYFAEARFLRAATYYNLVRMFGGVPIPESFTEGLEGLNLPRKTVDETYAYLIEDLEYAEANLPKKSEYGQNDIWRASKGAAQALLGDVYLTRGSMTGDRAYFQKAKDYCFEVIKSVEYDLEPDFKDLWFWWNTNNKNGMESVFELQYGAVDDEYNNNHVMFGVNITEYTLGCYMYRRFGPSIQHYLSYSDTDTRKEGSFLTSYNVTEKGNPSNILETSEFVPEDKGFYPGSKGWKTASPGNLKFYDRTPESAALKKPQANSYVIRYADVLLDYAEAENELNGPAAAYFYVNKVRNRADLLDLPSGLSPEEFSDAIYRERGWEFVGEGLLYYDGLRTDRIGENVKNHVEWGNQQGIYMYVDAPLEFVPSKNFLFKIPQYDYDSNPELVQNPNNVSN
ncbi:RagB/SusD family nutrient uptake outer membrane protein [Mariniflexile litorale]|uniref:RagB/SusD family nutrient uptake outer membrane protein n=1 Tax=Mariniflexile litorale TaxID=3045158 RepID=A0AAU7EGF2_9FLAO|nr:RagB/SusD family nutrient uptake outer membrane protein [Mariniflexile sp. KMM 9835]MDQ8210849.1 RagB/SusD family nutrient uptake outer membrane protein [Mariniflexile sp. KMM 9835]